MMLSQRRRLRENVPPFPASNIDEARNNNVMTRTELAREMFPQLDAETAGKRMCEIIYSSALYYQLRALGYEPNKSNYTIAQVRAIREFLRKNPHLL